ncbi:MAG: hypothetical protein AMJ62_09320 [Myxococcales bacterium SG8_38]|nr:MAG: hypothetical protein AMJ62_09320 [Myxococcales bacterium SG8_38]
MYSTRLRTALAWGRQHARSAALDPRTPDPPILDPQRHGQRQRQRTRSPNHLSSPVKLLHSRPHRRTKCAS